jgi:mannose-1-phosphate guanylyltransferase
MLHAIIMAGGSGTRFWPASRAARPKQLLCLASEKSLIAETVARLGDMAPPERVLIITNQRLVEPIREDLPQLPAGSIIGEPCRRDTAPCIGLAAEWVSQHDPDATMVVMPADHRIGPPEVFQSALQYAADLVDEDPQRLVTFGIRPTYPAESFGYIEQGEALADGVAGRSNSPRTCAVEKFKEKPRAEVAREYLDAGNYLWNSGIFVWRAAKILSELETFDPEMYGHIRAIGQSIATPKFSEVLASEFAAIDGRSIDYAVMEKAKNVVVVEAPFNWDDIGSWQAIARLRGTDESGNTIVAKHLGIDTKGTIVSGDDGHLIVTIGMDDCLVVHTPDATLVANKHREEEVREVVKLLEEKNWREHL